MPNSVETTQMYASITAMLDFYKAKAAKQGLESLTNQEKTHLKNIGSVLNLFRTIAIEQIILDAIVKDYSKVTEYYSDMESDLNNQISIKESKLRELTDILVEKIADKGDKSSYFTKWVNEADELRLTIAELREKLDVMIQSHKVPVDFVRELMNDKTSQILARQVIFDLIYSHDYLNHSSDVNEPTKLYERDRQGNPIVNEDLVQLTIDYISGKNNDLDDLREIIQIKRNIRIKEADLNSSYNFFLRMSNEVLTLHDRLNEHLRVLETVSLFSPKVKEGSNEVIGLRKKQLESKIEGLSSCIKGLKYKTNNEYEFVARRVPNLPPINDIFSSKENYDSFVALVKAGYESILAQDKSTAETEIQERTNRINPRYLRLNPQAINRITLYGRGKLKTDEFMRIKDSLELLKTVAKAQEGFEEPKEIIDEFSIGYWEDEARTAIEELISQRTI